MPSNHYRRRFLQLTGAGTLGALAGCTQLRSSISDEESDDTTTNDNGDTDTDIDPADGVVTQVGPSDEEAQMLQQSLMEEAEEEDWSEEKLHEEMNAAFEELVQAELEEFESWAADQDDISVAGRIDQAGLVLLDGTDEALMAALRNGDLELLVPGTEFTELEAALEEEEQQPPG